MAAFKIGSFNLIPGFIATTVWYVHWGLRLLLRGGVPCARGCGLSACYEPRQPRLSFPPPPQHRGHWRAAVRRKVATQRRGALSLLIAFRAVCFGTHRWLAVPPPSFPVFLPFARSARRGKTRLRPTSRGRCAL